MKHLLTALLFLASCKKPSPIDISIPNQVTVYQAGQSWYIEAKVSAPVPYKRYVTVETSHKLYPVVHNCVIIGTGNTGYVYKIPTSFGAVSSWRVLEWGKWND